MDLSLSTPRRTVDPQSGSDPTLTPGTKETLDTSYLGPSSTTPETFFGSGTGLVPTSESRPKPAKGSHNPWVEPAVRRGDPQPVGRTRNPSRGKCSGRDCGGGLPRLPTSRLPVRRAPSPAGSLGRPQPLRGRRTGPLIRRDSHTDPRPPPPKSVVGVRRGLPE